MSRKWLFVLLSVFAVVLVWGYTSVIPTDNDPRPVPTNTAGPSSGGGGDGASAEAGEALYDGQCASCHSTDGSAGIGPTWAGLFGSEITLTDGSSVVVDEAYVEESIRQPAAKVREGYQPIMPAFDLSDDEIDSLIAFMETLE